MVVVPLMVSRKLLYIGERLTDSIRLSSRELATYILWNIQKKLLKASCLKPLFQSEAWGTNEFNLHVNDTSFSCERMGTKTRFENEAEGNSKASKFAVKITLHSQKPIPDKFVLLAFLLLYIQKRDE